MTDAQATSIPDILFKYVDAKGGLATLEGKEISVMFSKPSDLNDPFEFLPSLDNLSFKPDELKDFEYLASPFLSATADSLRYEIELHWFITSFSRAEHNVRMWAQYGDDHRGICITFDLSKAPLSLQKVMMRPVDYTKSDRVGVSDFEKLSPEQKGERLKQVATQKGEDWEHEEEVRWFLRDDDRDRPDQQPFEKKVVDGKMRAFMKLPRDCIKRVTVGYRSPPALLRTVLEIRKMNEATWEVARTVLSLNSFRFEEELVSCSEA